MAYPLPKFNNINKFKIINSPCIYINLNCHRAIIESLVKSIVSSFCQVIGVMRESFSLHGGVGRDLGLDDFEGVRATRTLNHPQGLHNLFTGRFVCHFTIEGAHH